MLDLNGRDGENVPKFRLQLRGDGAPMLSSDASWNCSPPETAPSRILMDGVRWFPYRKGTGLDEVSAATCSRMNYGGEMVWAERDGTGWADTGFELGDRSWLDKHCESFRRWLEFLHAHTEDGTLRRYEDATIWCFLGDWARPSPGRRPTPSNPVEELGQRWEWPMTPAAHHYNNCTYAWILDIGRRIAEVVGREKDPYGRPRHPHPGFRRRLDTPRVRGWKL